MRDPRVAPEQLLRVARLFELNGDSVCAVMAYRDVLLAAEPVTTELARHRLQALLREARRRTV